MAERLDRELRQVSAALDGEGPAPTDPSPAAEAFTSAALRLRQLVRLEEAEVPPDVLPAVLAEVRRHGPSSGRAHRRPSLAVAACLAFLVAAVTAALATAPQWRGGDGVAAAEVRAEVLAAQAALDAADLDVHVEEYGAHPDQPVRRYRGALRWRAPEQLWLRLEQVGSPPEGWPANDLEVVVDDGVVVTEGVRACPVQSQPGCLRPRTRLVTGLPPFAEESVELMDLVVPVGAVDGRAADTVVARTNDRIELATTAGQVSRLLDALGRAGALRRVHPTDDADVELDADTLALRSLTVRAAAGTARSSWAASNGYDDDAGAVLLRLVATPRADTLPAPTVTAPHADVDAGFVDDPSVDVPAPTWLPPGFLAHRSGRNDAAVATAAYADGRAWVRIDWSSTDVPLAATDRPVEVGRGTGYRSVAGDRIVVVTGDGTAVVRGSIDPDQLLRVAAGLAREDRVVVGRPVPSTPADAGGLPPGALTGERAAAALHQPDGVILVVLDEGVVLTQRPGDVLPPPVKADVVEVVVRGTTGRWSPPLDLLVWGADDWVYELSGGPGADLDRLLAVAERLS